MDKIALVSVDLERGLELVEVLERASVKVNVALWVLFSEYEDWRLVIAAHKFDSMEPKEAYRLLHEILATEGFTPKNTPSVMILPLRDSFIKTLRGIFGKTKSVEGMRLGGQTIGDRFVEDAYVYKIS